MSEVHWATQSCVFGWAVSGIWPEGADGTDINALARTNKPYLGKGEKDLPWRHYLASADDAGAVRLFHYPCIQKRAHAHECVAQLQPRARSWPVHCLRSVLDRLAPANMLSTALNRPAVPKSRHTPREYLPPAARNRGHAAFVTNVSWTSDDTHVLSTGGGENTICQWVLVTSSGGGSK
jgi:WD40 repeat protein